MFNVQTIRSLYNGHNSDSTTFEITLKNNNTTMYETLNFNDYTKHIWEYLETLHTKDINSITPVLIRFDSSDTMYRFDNFAQLKLSIELFSFIWDNDPTLVTNNLKKTG